MDNTGTIKCKKTCKSASILGGYYVYNYIWKIKWESLKYNKWK